MLGLKLANRKAGWLLKSTVRNMTATPPHDDWYIVGKCLGQHDTYLTRHVQLSFRVTWNLLLLYARVAAGEYAWDKKGRVGPYIS